MYRQAVASLFDEQAIDREPEASAIAVVMTRLRRRELYRHLSNAADRIEVAAEVLHDIIVKGT